jgi:hypothetical protein
MYGAFGGDGYGRMGNDGESQYAYGPIKATTSDEVGSMGLDPMKYKGSPIGGHCPPSRKIDTKEWNKEFEYYKRKHHTKQEVTFVPLIERIEALEARVSALEGERYKIPTSNVKKIFSKVGEFFGVESSEVEEEEEKEEEKREDEKEEEEKEKSDDKEVPENFPGIRVIRKKPDDVGNDENPEIPDGPNTLRIVQIPNGIPQEPEYVLVHRLPENMEDDSLVYIHPYKDLDRYMGRSFILRKDSDHIEPGKLALTSDDLTFSRLEVGEKVEIKTFKFVHNENDGGYIPEFMRAPVKNDEDEEEKEENDEDEMDEADGSGEDEKEE